MVLPNNLYLADRTLTGPFYVLEGKFGAYFYDTQQACEMTLNNVATVLNNQHSKVLELEAQNKALWELVVRFEAYIEAHYPETDGAEQLEEDEILAVIQKVKEAR